MKRLVVSKAAEKDLRDIADYTEQRWGPIQRSRYMNALREAFARAATAPARGVPRDELKAGYRSVMAGRHVVFYRESDEQVEIVRVLHERMDLHGRLAEE